MGIEDVILNASLESTTCARVFLTSSLEIYLGRACCYLLWQRMDLLILCATSCTIPFANVSNHSAMDMLHPYDNATYILYVTLH